MKSRRGWVTVDNRNLFAQMDQVFGQGQLRPQRVTIGVVMRGNNKVRMLFNQRDNCLPQSGSDCALTSSFWQSDAPKPTTFHPDSSRPTVATPGASRFPRNPPAD